MSKLYLNPMSAAIGAAFAGSLALAQSATAAPFSLNDLGHGYQLVGDQQPADDKAKEGKCGEGKCGEHHAEHHKADKSTEEGKCGEGKCGEGKCGASQP